MQNENHESEKAKAQRGELYDANNDPLLLSERAACLEKLHRFNLLPPSQEVERKALIRQIIGNIHDDKFTFISPFFCDYGYNIEIGCNFFCNTNCVILDEAHVKFGDNVFIAPNCGFYTAGHPLDAHRRNLGLEYALPITIGNNVWICANVCILPGVSIGDNSVIAAGSVVTHDVPPSVLAGGCPCKVIRPITEEDSRVTRF